MKTPVKGNRDQLVEEHRLEIRLTKVQKDALQDLAKERQTTITNLIVSTLLTKSK